MKKFITLVEFGTQFLKKINGIASSRLMSIGSTSDGYFTFRCVDDAGVEKVFKISCWDNTPTAMIDRVEVLEHAIQYGNKAAVELLKSFGPDCYIQTADNYADLLYLLTGGAEGRPMEDF